MSKSKKPAAAQPAPEKSERDLTRQQKMFVEHYLRCWRGSEAARSAGYSERSAYSTSSDLLRNPKILAYIDQRMNEMAMQTDEILYRLSEHARVDVREFVNMTSDEIKASERGWLIKKFKSTSYTEYDKDGAPTVHATVDIELHDAQAALRTLAQARNLLSQKLDVTSNGKPLADTRPVIILDFGGDDDDNGGIGGE